MSSGILLKKSINCLNVSEETNFLKPSHTDTVIFPIFSAVDNNCFSHSSKVFTSKFKYKNDRKINYLTVIGTRRQPFRLWRISYGLPLTSELDALCAEDANPTVREAHGVASLFTEE